MLINEGQKERYKLSIEEGRVVLVARTFRAEKGSVLHSGIFSRELASSFVGAGLTLVFLVVVYFTAGVSLLSYALAAVLFALTTLLSRIFLFKEPFLETLIDKRGFTITLHRPLFKKRVQKSLSQLKDVRVEHRRFEPENPDAVEFVEKIALQHGTVIPGFGKPQDFYNLVLDFDDQSLVILTSDSRDDVEGVLVKLRSFLGMGG